MKIKQSDIKKARDVLSEIDYRPIDKKSSIFFEIDPGKTVEDDGFILEQKGPGKTGSAAYVRPGLVLEVDELEKGGTETYSLLAYANIEYSQIFDLGTYLDITGSRLSKKSREFIKDLDVYLVDDKYVLAKFDIE